jgi:transcriptional regulator with XRE-family HTH domain
MKTPLGLIKKRANAMLSQKDMAKRAGVSMGTVWRWEAGHAVKTDTSAKLRMAYEAISEEPIEPKAVPVTEPESMPDFNSKWLTAQVSSFMKGKEVLEVRARGVLYYLMLPQDLAEFAIMVARVLGKDIGGE